MSNLDLIIEYIEANQFKENQSVYGYGWAERAQVVDAKDLIKYIESLKPVHICEGCTVCDNDQFDAFISNFD